MAYRSFPKKKIKIFLKSMKLKQQDVSSEVLATAIDVKCNLIKQINANQGEMLQKFKYSDQDSDRAPGGGTRN